MLGFVSYAHADHRGCRTLLTHMGALEFEFAMTFWHDKSITAGSRWSDEIAGNIAEAMVFLLLFTPQFLKSPYILQTEIPAIQKRSREAGALVIPVVLEDCQWDMAGDLQAVPCNDRAHLPILDWKPQRAGFNRAREEIRAAIQKHFGLAGKKLFGDAP